jgi:small subunit ribosomal protein S2
VLEGKAAAPHAATVREEEFAEAPAAEDAKPARRAPAKKAAADKAGEAQA